MKLRILLAMLCAAGCFGGTINFPGSTLTIPAISFAGVSFVYSGTLTQADTIAFTQIGGTNNNPCLQGSGTGYCTNGAGVVTVAGTTAVGGTSTFTGGFNGTFGTWNFGALIMEVSGEGAVQVFPADAANGLGSSSPPTSLVLPATSLSALGFGSFSVVDPKITFVVADTNYADNGRQFILNQGSVPEPAVSWLIGAGLAALALVRRRVARRAA